MSELARVARHYVLLATTVHPRQRSNVVDYGTGHFVDRVYRPEYIHRLLSEHTTIVQETTVPVESHQYVLFEGIPRRK